MPVVGLTGGIGSGKSTVARLLERRGAVIIDADAIAREITAPDSPFLTTIATRFGSNLIRTDGSLDRAALGRIVFADPSARERLEALLHPPILATAAQRVEELRCSTVPPPVVVIMAPLLFEAHAEDMVDAVIVVTADEATRIQRIRERDTLNEAEVRSRFAAQIDPQEQQSRATWIIDNSGNLEETEKQVAAVWEEMITGHS